MHAVPNHAELEQAFEKSFEKEPASYSWGFFAYDDSPDTIGGGSGNFSWFDSKEELVNFLAKFPLLAHSLDTLDTERFTKAKNFVESVTSDDFDQKAVDELNKINAGVEQIQWFGQLDDLLSGETEFAKGMRAFFSKSSEKLAKSQIPEFAEFLRKWGH
ncbi:MAG: hypothetical protein P4L53_06575 [Candidatus Obscuribacterales bacterium]|nr:hypothetical protein [Candidatus Obscuribacterales bacterium]